MAKFFVNLVNITYSANTIVNSCTSKDTFALHPLAIQSLPFLKGPYFLDTLLKDMFLSKERPAVTPVEARLPFVGHGFSG